MLDGFGRRDFTMQLPKQWPRHVRSAILHAVSMAHVAFTAARARAEHHFSERVRLRARVDVLEARVAHLVEELRIKDARMERIDPQSGSPLACRPHPEAPAGRHAAARRVAFSNRALIRRRGRGVSSSGPSRRTDADNDLSATASADRERRLADFVALEPSVFPEEHSVAHFRQLAERMGLPPDNVSSIR
jgi:hypothetical protein